MDFKIKRFKIDINISIAHANKVEHVIIQLKKALEQTQELQQNPPPMVSLIEIRSDTLDFSISCWVNDISKSPYIRNELLKNIHLALQEGGINFPNKF